MSIAKKIIVRLPDGWQDRILAKVISSNKWKSVPTFNMLFESYVLMGADKDDMVRVFSESEDLGKSLYHNARRVAKNRERIAKSMEDDPLKAREEYQKAVMLYFLADWVSFEEDQITENYQDLLAVSNKIDALAEIETEKVFLPWRKGHIAGRYRIPKKSVSTSQSKLPLVILVQGNDTVKETLLFIEDELLKYGFAVFNVDQSGWGESRLSGNRYTSLNDAKILGEKLVDFCENQSEIDTDRLAVFGFSGGGTWSAMTAGTIQGLKVMVSVGGSIYNLDNSINHLPAMQKRQVMKHWGCNKAEISEKLKELDFDKILPNVHTRSLLVHGTKDTLVPVSYIKKAAEIIPGHVDLALVPGGDHMCSDSLQEVQLPLVMGWLQKWL